MTAPFSVTLTLVQATLYICSTIKKYAGMQEILKPRIWFVVCYEKALVLPLSVVDNLDFSANRLTALETLLMLASQGAYQAPHFKQWVQRFTAVDKSYISPTRLTAFSTLLILASQGALHAPNFQQRG